MCQNDIEACWNGFGTSNDPGEWWHVPDLKSQWTSDNHNQTHKDNHIRSVCISQHHLQCSTFGRRIASGRNRIQFRRMSESSMDGMTLKGSEHSDRVRELQTSRRGTRRSQNKLKSRVDLMEEATREITRYESGTTHSENSNLDWM